MKIISTLMLGTALTFGATAVAAQDHHDGRHRDHRRDFRHDHPFRQHRHWWHGRWWYEGHGPCWRRTRVGWVWVCGDYNDNGEDNDDDDDD